MRDIYLLQCYRYLHRPELLRQAQENDGNLQQKSNLPQENNQQQ